MNKILIAGVIIISHIAFVAHADSLKQTKAEQQTEESSQKDPQPEPVVQSESPQYKTQRFYVGTNIGWVDHTTKIKVKQEGIQGEVEPILTNLKKTIEGYQKAVDDGQKGLEEAEKKKKEALEAAAKPIIDALYTAHAKRTGQANSVAGDIDYSAMISALKGITAQIISDSEVLKVLGIDSSNSPAGELTPGKKDAFNNAVKVVITKIVIDGIDKKATIAGLDLKNMKYIIDDGYGREKVVSFSDSTKTDYSTASKKYEEAVSTFTLADNTLKAAKDFQEAFLNRCDAEGLKNTIEAIEKPDGIKAEAERIESLEKSELGTTKEGSRSVSKNGFVFEAVIGFDQIIDQIVIGANLSIAVDTFKGKIKDKNIINTDEPTKGVIVKRPFCIAITPKFGFLFTNQLEGCVIFGIKFNRYTVDNKDMTSVFDKETKLMRQTIALDKFKADKVTETEEAIKKAGDDKDAKSVAEIKKKIYTDIPVIDAQKVAETIAKGMKKHKKTKAVLVFGGGIKYRFTDNISGVFGVEFQPYAKVIDYNKTGNIQVKDKNYTVKFGIEFDI
jgi:hypothetical protein